ncbi:MAG: metal ABC transporter permease [Candidatus Methylacidiphilales bacterium]|nr:metal ABC transporter permease [Candidatus Methylacidiphilales bacterium]
MITYLLSPFQYPFMQDAMLMGALIGAVCAVLSCFLVLKGWSLMGDAISHAVLPGIVLAYMVGLPLSIGAFAAGLMCATATGYIKANSRLKEDTAMGIVFTGMFAAGLVLFTKVNSDQHLNHILFGNILGIEPDDMMQTTIICTITFFALMLMKKDLLLYCFDSGHARTIGINTTFLHYALLSMLAATIVASLQAVGVLLVIAMLVTPGCIAYMLTDRFDLMLLSAFSASVFSCVFGAYISFLSNASTAGCIVLTQSSIFILAMIFGPKYGLIAQSRAFVPSKPTVS